VGTDMTDRNIIYPNGNTIFWKHFISFVLNTQEPIVRDMGLLYNRELFVKTEDGTQSKSIMLSYIPRSIIKLQSLGVLQYDFITTLGTSSPTYIDRFHITFFGQKILEYIDIEDNSDED
jgi:hypothetical protein